MEIRFSKHDSFCRGCDKEISKGTKIFYTYSIRNRGQNIIFCMDCLNLMNDFWLKEFYTKQNIDFDGEEAIGFR